MQQRLERYQQAVAASSSPHVKPPQTPESRPPLAEKPVADRSPWSDALRSSISFSTATPSRSHAAPSTPAKRDWQAEELPESPTDSKPHSGPVFLHRPPTPGKDILNGAALLQTPYSGHSSLAEVNLKGQKQKPPGYLGAYMESSARPDRLAAGHKQRNAGYMAGLPRPKERESPFVAGLQAN